MAGNNRINKQEKIAKALKNQQARGGDSAIAHEEEIARKISPNQNLNQSQRNLDSVRPINPQVKSSPTMGISEDEPENIGNFKNINRGQQQKVAAEDLARNEAAQTEAQAPQNSVPTTGPQAEANKKPPEAIGLTVFSRPKRGLT